MNLIFERAGEHVIVKIDGKRIIFSTEVLGFRTFVPIEMLKLDIQGILREFPDLAGRPDAEIKQEGIKRFRDKIQNMESEQAIKEYLIDEFKKMGYALEMIERAGFRNARL